jgi:Cu(I)/Ag(I) efflux system periplasmic protein CusF
MKSLLTLAVAATVAISALAQAPTSTGEVTKIDAPHARITLKHKGVKSLDMPPMTLTFRVADLKLLQGLAVGDEVRFAAEKIDGSYTVTAISKAR